MKDNNKQILPEGHLPDPDFYELGSITFTESLLEEEIIGNKRRINFNSIGECKIEVYRNEGIIPHFHLSTKDRKFECCICIYSNNFFSHGGKYRGTLSGKQCKQLNDYLSSDSKVSGFTVWDLIRATWETSNMNNVFPDNRKVNKQPDYSNMTQFKDA